MLLTKTSRIWPQLYATVYKGIQKPQIGATSFLRYFCDQRHIVQMRGLDYEATEQDVINFFKPLGIEPKSVSMKYDGSGRVAGVSEVEFATHADAVVAMRKRNAFMGHRFIRLTLKSSEPDNNRNENSDISSSGQISSQSKVGINILGSLKTVSAPNSHVIRMKNAPRRMTDQAIYEFFWPVGIQPVSVKPIYNESGIRTGEFDVQFLTREDAVRALVKNHAYLGKKFVEISLKVA
ncbi:Heterogeneous nuclear ribonucleoprotein F, partial [Stegodyphus mimosarum]